MKYIKIYEDIPLNLNLLLNYENLEEILKYLGKNNKLTNNNIPFGMDIKLFKELLKRDLIDFNYSSWLLILQKVINKDDKLVNNKKLQNLLEYIILNHPNYFNMINVLLSDELKQKYEYLFNSEKYNL